MKKGMGRAKKILALRVLQESVEAAAVAACAGKVIRKTAQLESITQRLRDNQVGLVAALRRADSERCIELGQDLRHSAETRPKIERQRSACQEELNVRLRTLAVARKRKLSLEHLLEGMTQKHLADIMKKEQSDLDNLYRPPSRKQP